MESTIIKVIFYCALAIGTAIISVCLYVITDTQFAILEGTESISMVKTGKAENKETGDELEYDDFLAWANMPERYTSWTPDFFDKIVSGGDSFIYSRIRSNSGDKEAYAELSLCAGYTHKYDLNKVKTLPPCQWEASIHIRDLITEEDRVLNTITGDEKFLSGSYAEIYYPAAWTKNDQRLILRNDNIGYPGHGGASPKYMAIGAKEGKNTEFYSRETLFFDDYGKAFILEDSDTRLRCGEGVDEGGTNGKIVLIDTETGKKKTIVDEGRNRRCWITSFNRITNVLTYKYQTYESTGNESCRDTAEPPVTKQVKINPTI